MCLRWEAGGLRASKSSGESGPLPCVARTSEGWPHTTAATQDGVSGALPRLASGTQVQRGPQTWARDTPGCVTSPRGPHHFSCIFVSRPPGSPGVCRDALLGLHSRPLKRWPLGRKVALTGSSGQRTPEPPLPAATSPCGPRPPTLSLAPRPWCRAVGAAITTMAMPVVTVLILQTTVSPVPVAVISAAFIIIPLWRSPQGCVPASQREESSAGALCPLGNLGSVWRHPGPPSWIGGLRALSCRGWGSAWMSCDA